MLSQFCRYSHYYRIQTRGQRQNPFEEVEVDPELPDFEDLPDPPEEIEDKIPKWAQLEAGDKDFTIHAHLEDSSGDAEKERIWDEESSDLKPSPESSSSPRNDVEGDLENFESFMPPEMQSWRGIDPDANLLLPRGVDPGDIVVKREEEFKLDRPLTPREMSLAQSPPWLREDYVPVHRDTRIAKYSSYKDYFLTTIPEPPPKADRLDFEPPKLPWYRDKLAVQKVKYGSAAVVCLIYGWWRWTHQSSEWDEDTIRNQRLARIKDVNWRTEGDLKHEIFKEHNLLTPEPLLYRMLSTWRTMREQSAIAKQEAYEKRNTELTEGTNLDMEGKTTSDLLDELFDPPLKVTAEPDTASAQPQAEENITDWSTVKGAKEVGEIFDEATRILFQDDVLLSAAEEITPTAKQIIYSNRI